MLVNPGSIRLPSSPANFAMPVTLTSIPVKSEPSFSGTWTAARAAGLIHLLLLTPEFLVC